LFLTSRGIELPQRAATDPPDVTTVHEFGNLLAIEPFWRDFSGARERPNDSRLRTDVFSLA
jgi:hypothetical protein